MANSLFKSGAVGTILMDLSKPFGCLSHELILVKLYAYGVDRKIFEILQAYLSYRFQVVKPSSTFSSWLDILLRVPEGSILGSFSFNIFLNDLLWFDERTDICKLTDDNPL